MEGDEQAAEVSSELEYTQVTVLLALFVLALKARQYMAASSSYGSVVESILLQWLAMAAVLSRLCFMASTSVEEQLPSFEILQHSSAKVVGMVFCDCCLEGSYTQNAAFLPDVTVAVECKNSSGSEIFAWKAASNRKGSFVLLIPPQETIQKCWIQLLNNPHGVCNSISKVKEASQFMTTSLKSSIGFTVGEFSYQPKSPFSFCKKELDFHSLYHKQQIRLLPESVKNLYPKALEGFIPAHGLLHQYGKRSLQAIMKHGQPSSYHLEPPDPPQPFYPADKRKNKASTPPNHLIGSPSPP